ncbi:hypothetical protein G4B88_003387 [Cannabis sativa]|uniref:Uncharacterized protein n=1 Tax=Cannabis sativa TaxID=3483 RepID=A0A7J6EPY5_CANSA|nr:hypothetical protein G4B88_003387 [Cannabis sativa]
MDDWPLAISKGRQGREAQNVVRLRIFFPPANYGLVFLCSINILLLSCGYMLQMFVLKKLTRIS